MREAPYKVVVWGPGILGSLLLREILQLPELELVGVLAYSQGKDGVDVGTYLGSDPIGVTMTTDKQQIFDLDADCVLFCRKSLRVPTSAPRQPQTCAGSSSRARTS